MRRSTLSVPTSSRSWLRARVLVAACSVALLSVPAQGAGPAAPGQAVAESSGGEGVALVQVDDRDAAARREIPRRPTVQLAFLAPGGQVESSRRRALEGLSATVARRTSVEMDVSEPPVLQPLDQSLFDHPLVFMTGDEPLEPWSEPQLDAMRTYLSLGGMVVVDDASGEADSEFSRTAKTELSRVLGGREPRALPADHAILRSYYLLDRAWGRLDVKPELDAIVLDGRAAVLFSSNDLLGALGRDEFGRWSLPTSPGGRRQREEAHRLGVNIVLYALTLDYKEDLVHLPHILERRR